MAIALQIPPAALLQEEERMVATLLDELERQAREVERMRRSHHG